MPSQPAQQERVTIHDNQYTYKGNSIKLCVSHFTEPMRWGWAAGKKKERSIMLSTDAMHMLASHLSIGDRLTEVQRLFRKCCDFYDMFYQSLLHDEDFFYFFHFFLYLFFKFCFEIGGRLLFTQIFFLIMPAGGQNPAGNGKHTI